jgi:hypothetical protein
VAILFFAWEQRKERDNEEEEQYQLLSGLQRLPQDRAGPDLQLRANEPLADPTPEQRERMLVIFDMLISLFERAYLVAYKPRMGEDERRRWNSWDDYMREWCHREDFHPPCRSCCAARTPNSRSYIHRPTRSAARPSSNP